ncbi:hypothetical protein D5S18_15900 [Nocardia panacis]|uniref:Bro-N domain-containing protein n=1 Tax=Nocardia panacis TaxID=2340916 RepID=A0A3A4KG21_9NOCA|nr:BRO family protein [Nocardia panacis]RJO74898.1 hypothetical protein D5S18_15900 [Nocardia panacis]
MPNEIQPFEFNGAQVRTLVVDGEPWFVAKDVTDILGFKKGYEAVTQHVLPAQRTTVNCGSGLNPKRVAINEAGLYRLLMRSNVPGAERFQAWVTDEILPAIRKTGRYDAVQLAVPQTYAEALRAAADQYERAELETAKRLELEANP